MEKIALLTGCECGLDFDQTAVETVCIGDELPDWLRGIGDAFILRRSRNDIDRIGATRELVGVPPAIMPHAERLCIELFMLTSVSEPALTLMFDTYDTPNTSSV